MNDSDNSGHDGLPGEETVFGGAYELIQEKPDKKFSHLFTILSLCQPLSGRTVIELGCGTGTYTRELAKGAAEIFAYDHDPIAIRQAPQLPNVRYAWGDMRAVEYFPADVICAPYIFNYLPTVSKLDSLVHKLSASLKPYGKIVGLMDAPKQLLHNNKKFGSIKSLASFTDEVPISIRLCHNDREFRFTSYYFLASTIEQIFHKNGLHLKWCEPMVDVRGIKLYGREFWTEYLQQCDVSYFTAEKQ